MHVRLKKRNKRWNLLKCYNVVSEQNIGTSKCSMSQESQWIERCDVTVFSCYYVGKERNSYSSGPYKTGEVSIQSGKLLPPLSFRQ